MTAPSDPVGFVLGSTARREVLARLAEGGGEGRAIVRDSSASESAVYDSLNRLAERGLVHETADGAWQLTGAGRLVADAIEGSQRLGSVIGTDEEYWQNHDPSAIPARFRRELDLLEGCEIVRSPDADPYRASRTVERTIEEADDLKIIGAAYNDRHAEALLHSDADRKLLMVPQMVERLLRDDPAGPDRDGMEGLEIRVADASFSMNLSERHLLLSLPRSDGGFDPTTELRVDTEAAAEWGERLFEHYWQEATPVEEWIATELPEYAEGEADSRHLPPEFDR